MADRRTSDVLGGLPHSRPHRRSEKRGSRPIADDATGHEAPPQDITPNRVPGRSRAPGRATGSRPTTASSKQTGGAAPKAATPKSAARSRISQPAQPGGTPRTPRADQPEPQDRPDILGTAVQAAAELAEIGLTVGARALRTAMSRLPRP
jgi:hypothetical protein